MPRGSGPPIVPPLRNPRIRGVLIQVALAAAVVALAAVVVSNVADNLARAKLTTGFGFWNVTAGFEISQTLIDYSAQSSTYGRAFWVGLLNTLLVAVVGIVLATVLGFALGVARLSNNWLVARLAGAYVELVRNVPLLLQLLFWYNAVLKALPEFRDSIRFWGGGYLNNRGLFLPQPVLGEGGGTVVVAGVLGLAAAVALVVAGRRRGVGALPLTLGALALAIGLPAVIFMWLGGAVSVVYPEVTRFGLRGGIEVLPEFVALVVGLVIYTAAFIAEVVRAGILSVPKGQSEAAHALGLRRLTALRLVIIPQAMRVIIPPLTNQYLNLTKNSSLAVAIGYPDLVQIFAGTVLNQTGQAIEVVVITMAVYFVISLATSALMNFYHGRLAWGP